MNGLSPDINERQAATAFSKQSQVFDAIYSGNTIVQYKRRRVRDHVLQYLPPHSSILELNSGTGEDAIYFAQNGHLVHATDISTGMQEMLRKKVQGLHLENNISSELCSFTQLGSLQNKGPYDLVFSNFGGLNCTNELAKVLSSLPALVKPGGTVSLVVLSKFCLWEFLLLFKGRFKTAMRRFFSKNGTQAHIEGEYFTCWYYHPSFIKKQLEKSFDLVTVEGLCTLVPPSYVEHFAERYPRAYQFLQKQESRLKSKWPWKNVGDYFIITLRKR